MVNSEYEYKDENNYCKKFYSQLNGRDQLNGPSETIDGSAENGI